MRAKLPGFRFLSLTLTSCILKQATECPMYFNLCLQKKVRGNYNTAGLIEILNINWGINFLTISLYKLSINSSQ